MSSCTTEIRANSGTREGTLRALGNFAAAAVAAPDFDGFFFALCCLGKIPGGAPFSQLHKGGKQRRVDRP